MRATLLLTCLLLGACDLAPPPPADPDTSASAREAARHNELQDAIDSVDKRDKAAAANAPVEAADKKREEDLKAAGG